MTKKSVTKIATYVYDGREIYLTGRIANVNTKTAKRNQSPLVEILPVGTPMGDTTYAQWVRTDELFVIDDLDDDEDTNGDEE